MHKITNTCKGINKRLDKLKIINVWRNDNNFGCKPQRNILQSTAGDVVSPKWYFYCCRVQKRIPNTAIVKSDILSN